MAKIDPSKIIKKEEDKTKKLTKYILKNGTYLSEVLEKLPSGIIHKNHTGIGATTLELESERHSLIVEPLRITASSKAASRPNTLYIGSATKYHPKKTSKREIIEYIKSKSIKHKKIFCVVDSLKIVIPLLEKHGLKDYFLCIDESDSLQIESNFRQRAMEKAIEYYKKHNTNFRCLLSATPIKFNDPDLSDENITSFEYEENEVSDINIIKVRNTVDCIIEKIKSLNSEFPSEKIVVAYNNIEKIVYIAEELEKSGVKDDDIKILCSRTSKKQVGKYFYELESDLLPGLINLKTSAYFTGFDINERYHLIIAVDTSDILNMPSDKRIKQIAGRCRVRPDGLYSLNLALNESKEVKIPAYDFKILCDNAEKEVNALNCISSMFDPCSIFYNQVKGLRSLLARQIQIDGYNIVFEDRITNTAKISYLAIDAVLETKATIEKLYSKKGGLESSLKKEGNRLSFEECLLSGKSSSSLVTKRLREDSKEFLKKKLEDISKGGSFILEHVYNPDLSPFESKVLRTYDLFADYIDKEYLVKELIKIVNSYSTQKLNNFIASAKFSILEESSSFKQALMKFFPLNKKITLEQRDEQMIKVFEKLGLGIKSEEIDKKALSYIFQRTINYTKGKDDKTGQTMLNVKGYNPLNLKIEYYKKEENDYSFIQMVLKRFNPSIRLEKK